MSAVPYMGSLAVKLRHGDGVAIGPDVEVRVISVIGNQVALRINAPHSVRISRMTQLQRPVKDAGPSIPVEQPDEMEQTLQAVRSASESR